MSTFELLFNSKDRVEHPCMDGTEALHPYLDALETEDAMLTIAGALDRHTWG